MLKMAWKNISTHFINWMGGQQFRIFNTLEM